LNKLVIPYSFFYFSPVTNDMLENSQILLLRFLTSVMSEYTHNNTFNMCTAVDRYVL